jgi:hypothetical protein
MPSCQSNHANLDELALCAIPGTRDSRPGASQGAREGRASQVKTQGGEVQARKKEMIR